MPQIENIATSTLIPVAEQPVWVNGIWECGDHRFTDPLQTLYSVAPSTTMKAVLWYNCFTPSEAIAIRASTDPLIKEFVYRLEQLIAAGETIDTSLGSVQEGVNYLASIGLITSARVSQIIAGALQ